MKNANKKYSDTNIRINCRLSYAHLFEPRAIEEGGDKKYSCTLLVDKNDAQAVKLVREAEAAAQALFKSKFGDFKGKLKSVVYDGDESFPGDEVCEGMLVIRSSSKTKPGVNVLEPGVGIVDPLDESEVYSGCYGAADVNFYPYSTTSSKGISCGLNNIIKMEDGEVLGGSGKSAEASFGDLV